MKTLKFYFFILFFTACSLNQEQFFNDKQEIAIRTIFKENNTIISYLGVLNGDDYLAVSSKMQLKFAKIDGVLTSLKIAKKHELELPYQSNFLNTYIIYAPKSLEKELILDLEFENNYQINGTKITRISKSLNYHLEQN